MRSSRTRVADVLVGERGGSLGTHRKGHVETETERGGMQLCGRCRQRCPGLCRPRCRSPPDSGLQNRKERVSVIASQPGCRPVSAAVRTRHRGVRAVTGMQVKFGFVSYVQFTKTRRAVQSPPRALFNTCDNFRKLKVCIITLSHLERSLLVTVQRSE